MAKKAKGHTGHIRHEDMVMLHGSHGRGGKDPHASAEHHRKNKEAGMSEGLSPTNMHSYGDGEHDGGGEGMAGNAECCD